jgi:hypothetical protein
MTMILCNISDRLLDTLSQLQAQNGVESLSHGGWYVSRNLGDELEEVIYDVCREYAQNLIKSRPTVSISLDESDTVAKEKVLAIVLKTVLVQQEKIKCEKRRGVFGLEMTTQTMNIARPTQIPLVMIEIHESDAESLLKEVLAVLDDWEISEESVSSMSTDGASVMQGKISGVCTLFHERHNPSCIGIHCVAHRLNLCCKDGTKNNTVLNTLDKTLEVTHDVFSRSSHRCDILRNEQKRHNEPALKIKSHSRIRWKSKKVLIHMARSCPKSLKSSLFILIQDKNLKKTS